VGSNPTAPFQFKGMSDMEKRYFKALMNATWFFGMLAIAVGFATMTASGIALALLGVMALTFYTCNFYELKKSGWSFVEELLTKE